MNIEHISTVCDLIKNVYVTNTNIIKYMKKYYNSKTE